MISRGRVVECDTPARLGDRQKGTARVTWLENGHHRELQTMAPTKAVSDLSARFDGEIPGLTVQRARLEDVYLALLDGDRYAEGGDSE